MRGPTLSCTHDQSATLGTSLVSGAATTETNDQSSCSQSEAPATGCFTGWQV